MKNPSASHIFSRTTGKPAQPCSILDHSIATRVSTKLVALCFGVSVAAVSPSAMAATLVWDGGGVGGTNMDTAVNWNPNTVPSGAASDVAQWDGTVAGDLSLNYTAAGTGANLSANPGVSLNITSAQTGALTINEVSGTSGLRLQNLTVASGAGALTFGGVAGTDFLTLASTAVLNHIWTNNSADAVTFSSDVSFGAGGGVTHTLNLTGTGNWNVNTSLIRNGTGTINVVKDGVGTLNVGNVNALGNAAFTMVAGTLDNTSGAALTLTNTTQTWNGNFAFSTETGTTANDLSLGAGTVSLGTGAGTSRTITTNGSALLTVAGVVSNGTSGNSIIKAGTGGLRLDGTNTYTGGTTLQAGQLHIANNAALGTGTLTINGGVVVPRLAARTLANAVTVGGDFTLGLVGFNNQINFSGTVDLGGTTRIITVVDTTINPDANFTGVISNGGLTKAGTGTMVLTGNSTYTGSTTVTEGTLILSGTGTINGSSGITVDGFGARLLQTSSVASTPTLTLTQGTLDGTGTVGAVNVGTSGAAILANGNGGTGMLTTGNLSFGGDATVNVASTGASPGIAAGALTTSGLDGAIIVNINRTGAWNNGANNLISYTSFASADINDFTLSNINGPALGARQSIGGLVLNGNNIALQIDGTSIYWTGLQSNQWTVNPVGGLRNWKQTSDNSATEFIDGDDVVFNDTPGTNQTIQINDADVFTTTTSFNNSAAVNYTISGNFGISGGSLTKNGTGSVTLNTANFYSGGTTLNAGTLNVGNANALGFGSVTINGGTLNNTSGGAIALTSNNAQNWNGDFTFAGTDSLDMGTGAVTLGGTGDRTVTVSANTLTVGEIKAAGTQGLVKQGAGTLVLTSSGSGAAASTLGGILNVAAGTLQINRTGDPTGGDLTATGLTGSGTITHGGTNERWLIINTSGTNTFSGTLANGDSGALGFNKQGTGTVTLSGNNTYSGTTTIGGGMLVLAGTNTGAGPVNVAIGILNIQNSNALGGGVVTSVSRNAGIQLQGGISLPSSVTFITSNDGTTGALVPYAIDNVSGNNTINGTITLTSGGGGSIIQSDSGALTLAGNITIAAAQTSRGIILQGASTDANTFSGALSDLSATAVASVTKSGTGNWTLSGANIYTGPTSVTNGTLNITGSLSNTAVTISGGTLSLQSASAISQNVITVSGTGALVETADNAIGGTATLVVQNSNVTISRPNAYSGDTRINAGTNTTLTVTHPSGAGTGRFDFATGATTPVLNLHIGGGGTIAMPNSLGGNSGVTSTIDVNNNGSGTGGTIQLNGTPNPAAALGNATINVTGGNGYSLLISSIINNAGAAGSTTFNPTTANLTIGSFSSSTAFAKTLVLDGTSDDNEVTGVIANGTAGTVALTKSNTSTWTLSSTNTYTGATTVNGGTLIFGASQTLSSLTIADGATVVLAEDLTPAPAPSGEEVVAFTALGTEAADLDGAASSFNGASHVSAVPEPGSLALLAFGALSLCRRRAGASRR